ncbi:MAG: hypothetical protein AB1797_04725 [bacterium]
MIIEPHYDDAWVNLGGAILKNPALDFTILSISEHKGNNLNETKKLEDTLPNVKTKALKYKTLLWGLEAPKSNWKDLFCELNGLKNYSEFEEKVRQEVKGYDLVLLPLGVKHPQHILISEIDLPGKVKYYREFPYFFPEKIKSVVECIPWIKKKLGHQREVFNKIKDNWAEEIDITDFVEKKLQIFEEVYKSQLFLSRLDKKGYNLRSLKTEVLYENIEGNHWGHLLKAYAATLKMEFW